MESNPYELTVSQPPKPLWKNVIASMFFTMAVFAIYAIITQPHFSKLNPDEQIAFNKNVIFIIVGIFMGFYCAVTTTIMIDTHEEKLVTVYTIGPFSKKKISRLPKLDYVGLHKNRDEIYLIRIWYAKNKRYTMCYTEEKQPAFQFAQMVAQKLNLDLLDATERGNPKWIEKTPV